MPVIAKPYVLALLILCFFSFTLAKNKPVKNRTVYILSGGFSAAHGHHVIILNPTSARVDTSFFPLNDGFTYFTDSAYIKKNRIFSKDIETALETKHVYQSLMSFSQKTLKEYAIASQKTDSIYFAQEIMITENKQTDTLRFHIPVKLKEGSSGLNQFLFELGHIFPFDGCRSSYISFYKGFERK
jgi:hypothetical protein